VVGVDWGSVPDDVVLSYCFVAGWFIVHSEVSVGPFFESKND
jgi:hypothetical protein